MQQMSMSELQGQRCAELRWAGGLSPQPRPYALLVEHVPTGQRRNLLLTEVLLTNGAV